jgi:hypothetical protein
MAYDRAYLVTALLYVVAGMVLGIVMAATQNHSQHVTHAHILLVGFVISFAYAVLHRLWLRNAAGTVAVVQFALHQLGSIVIVVCLYLLYGNILPLQTLEPVLAGSSIALLLGVLLMFVLLARFGVPAEQGRLG